MLKIGSAGILAILFLCNMIGSSWAAEGQIRFTSELLFRYENQDFPDPNVRRVSVDRYRIRWRPAIQAFLQTSFQFGIEAETNWIEESDDEVTQPRFPEFHTPLFDRDNFRRNTVVLSKAFLQFKPSPNFSAVVGKFDNPFLISEMVWDDDLHPNGAALSLSREAPTGNFLFSFHAADFYATHYLHDRTNILAAQGIIQANPGKARLTFSIAYYDLNVDELSPALLRTNTRSGLLPANDYNLLDFLARFRLNARFPISAQINWVINTAAHRFTEGIAGNGDRALLWEFTIGRLESAPSLRLSYTHHRVESDAVLAAYNTDEWWFPSRGEGYRIRGSVKPVNPLVLSVSYLNQSLIGTKPTFERWQFSLELSWPRP